MQLGEHINTADKDLVEEWEIGLKGKAEVSKIKDWKIDPNKKRLQTMKNLSVFNLKLFFFIEVSLKEAR